MFLYVNHKKLYLSQKHVVKLICGVTFSFPIRIYNKKVRATSFVKRKKKGEHGRFCPFLHYWFLNFYTHI